jgi:hypothetical protein
MRRDRDQRGGESLSRAVAGILGVSWVVAQSVQALGGDLRGDLTRLNVRHVTAHYELAGTVSNARLEEYGRCLEYIYAEYARGFGELVPGKVFPVSGRPGAVPRGPQLPRFRVIVFDRQAEYDEFARANFDGTAEHTRGLFVPGAELLLIRDEADSAETYETLFHEAWHEFVHRFVPWMPIWLNEGLAVHYGTARPTAGGLAFDRPPRHYYRIVESAALAGQLIPLRTLLGADRAWFYESARVPGLEVDRRTLCYAQSYTLAAYMVFDEQGREHLRRFIRRLAGARDEGDVAWITRELFPEELLGRMVPAWLEHVRKN